MPRGGPRLGAGRKPGRKPGRQPVRDQPLFAVHLAPEEIAQIHAAAKRECVPIVELVRAWVRSLGPA